MTLKFITDHIAQDSNLKKYCIEVLTKTLHAFLTATEGETLKSALTFKIESIDGNVRFIQSRGICLITKHIAFNTPGEEVTYGYKILSRYLLNVALSGNVDHLLSYRAKYEIKYRERLSGFWFYENYGKIGGYHDRVQFLRYCLEHLKNQN